MNSPDLFVALNPVIKEFEKLSVEYYIGGSVASSAYGIARSTLDIDLVADLKQAHVKQFVEDLESEYYIDKNMIQEAIRRHSSFNLIHLTTMLKVDIFVLEEAIYPQKAFERKRKELLDEEEKSSEYYLVSPEDIILIKLNWFLKGGGVSERQWLDILGVLKVQKTQLDKEYLEYWAEKLKLLDLLKRIFDDAGF